MLTSSGDSLIRFLLALNDKSVKIVYTFSTGKRMDRIESILI